MMNVGYEGLVITSGLFPLHAIVRNQCRDAGIGTPHIISKQRISGQEMTQPMSSSAVC